MMQLNDLGNVRETMTWIITDNLFIDPSSATSVISVLKTLKAQVDVLEHKTIYFHISDLEKEFLQVSLKSKTVLTDVFLRQTGWRKSKNGWRPSVVPSAAESSVFGKSQASQVRSQQLSQQSLSQGFSSQQPIYSQLSQSSLDEFIPNEQRLISQEREKSAKRMSCMPQINYTREESKLQLSKPSTNYMHKWSVPENKSRIIGLNMLMNSNFAEQARLLKNLNTKLECLRPELKCLFDLSYFLIHVTYNIQNKGREDLKAILEMTFKPMLEELRENKYQENIRDLLSLLRAMPNKLEMSILQLQTD
ncbi:hypothetical protein RND71_001121 [Anisodus tanguticus]|uniref:Uncharacterized protein n=1 Tax=Anisodus tanguticus TaxID=243964 RepID=A0AAE1SYN9_9SOLA|nr:hypothetical protein RND71_001121 [Anisodus tanguticus]